MIFSVVADLCEASAVLGELIEFHADALTAAQVDLLKSARESVDATLAEFDVTPMGEG